MTVTIKEIFTRREVRQFSRFPLRLYRNCEQYVPSLMAEEVSSIMDSPCMEYCQRKMIVALDEKGRIVGRAIGIINPRANALFGYKRLRIGWIDFIEDFDVCKALVDDLCAWGREHGMTQAHGPLGYNTWNKQGMVVEGFENLPQFNCLYNYAYYPQYFERLGFTKEVDWLQYMMPASQPVPEKVERINQLILKRYNLHVVPWKTARDLDPYMDDFFSMYNQSFSTVHNFIPLTDAEARSSIAKYLRFLTPDLSCFVADQDNKIVAFSITLPSLSRALQKARGHMFPFGWIYMLRALKSYKDIDLMLNGAHPDWQGKGLSSIYHYTTNVTSVKRNLRTAVTNPQIESNRAIEVWKSYETTLHTRRRCYIKDI